MAKMALLSQLRTMPGEHNKSGFIMQARYYFIVEYFTYTRAY